MNNPDDQALAHALVMMAVRLPRVLRALDDASTLTPTEASALAVLVHGGAMNIGELARHEDVRPPSMTRTVTQLESKGLVERRPSETDGRAWLVDVTPIGRKLFREGHQRKLAPLVTWLHELEPSTKKKLIVALPTLLAMSMLESPTNHFARQPEAQK